MDGIGNSLTQNPDIGNRISYPHSDLGASGGVETAFLITAILPVPNDSNIDEHPRRCAQIRLARTHRPERSSS